MDEEKFIEMGYSPEIACKMKIFDRSFLSGDDRVLNDPEYRRLEKRLRVYCTITKVQCNYGGRNDS